MPILQQCILFLLGMRVMDKYKWVFSASWRLIKHKLHIKVAKGGQDRSEQRVFTVIKVNSTQPLGITLLLRHMAVALSSQLYGLGPSASDLQILLFFKGKKRKHVKTNLSMHSLLPLTPTLKLPSPLLVSHP